MRRLCWARLADIDLRSSRILKKRRQPAQLEFCAAVDQHIGIAQRYDKAWPRIDKVRIFRCFGQNREVDLVSADFTGERAEVRQSRDDVYFCMCRERAR